MKPVTPDDSFDELIAAALHGELTPEERAQFDLRLQTDAAAQAAYRKALAMHDLLEKTHKEAQPDPAFEQRMVSGVRRKIQTEHRETAWESFVALGKGVKAFFAKKRQALPGMGRLGEVLVILFMIAILSGVALGPITNGIKKAKQSSEVQAGHAIMMAEFEAQADAGANPVAKSVKATPDGRIVEVGDDNNEVDITDKVHEFMKTGVLPVDQNAVAFDSAKKAEAPNGGQNSNSAPQVVPTAPAAPTAATPLVQTYLLPPAALQKEFNQKYATADQLAAKQRQVSDADAAVKAPATPSAADRSEPTETVAPKATEQPAAVDDRKLIRNAQLDLEVKSFQTSMDQITAQTRAAGGYVDTSNSQKGGNGKLQGTVVVKVLPQNLDDFLLKLRDLGEVQNQSVSTDDVTKDYFDTQARLVNSQKMEAQLQDLLKRENGKVSDLLAVERELGRVRGEIEQMQGQLKLYDFQVQYATVTMNMSEKDLNKAAAYLLKEQDDFSLFATDVEGTFQKARQAADDFKAQVLTANLNHNSGTDVSAELEVMVAPDQIEAFLTEVRGLGRVANFTRQTQRVAKDGGDSAQPADETMTEKDKVQVHLAIRSDDETRKQVALTVVAKAVDVALDQAKAAASANAGTEILSSALNKTPEGQSTAQLTVRVPGTEYSTLIAAFNALGRTSSLSIQRNDDSGPGANGDDAPVIVSLSLTDDDAPLQKTALTVAGNDVDAESQQIKKAAGDAGVEVKASNFQHQPDGTDLAQMTFRLPMAKYPAFLESVKALGKVESLTVQRNDRPDETRTDDSAPAEITLQLHNQREIIADDEGIGASMLRTFGEGAGALLTSVRVIGVMVAFMVPWVITLGLIAWVGRRIYIWRKGS